MPRRVESEEEQSVSGGDEDRKCYLPFLYMLMRLLHHSGLFYCAIAYGVFCFSSRPSHKAMPGEQEKQKKYYPVHPACRSEA